MLHRVAILTHPRGEEAERLAIRATRTLERAGITVERTRRRRGEDTHLAPGTDMLLAIGGDGTVLRAQRLAIPARAPVLGVAAGRLGFLAEVEPRELDSALSRILAGDCRVEQRCLLGLTHLRRDKELSTQTAVNDVVIRGRAPRSLWIAVWVDGAHVANYVADGIIAATATGSTAYSLAAGGPILAPELGNILLTPVAAHLSFVQSLVLAETARVQLGLVRPQDAYLSVDGQGDPAFLHGDRLLVEKSEQTARFVRVSPPSEFYAQLVERLQHNLSRSPDPGASSRGTERP